MKKILIAAAYLVVTLGACGQFKPNAYDTQTDAVVDGNVKSNAWNQSGNNPRLVIPLSFQTNIDTSTSYASWPQAALDTNGDFVVEFCIGNRHLLTNRAVYMVKSTNSGLSWSTPVQIYTNANMDVSLGVAFGIHQRTGRYILMGAQQNVTTGIQTNTFIKYSDDHGVTWSDAASFQKFTGFDNTNCPTGVIATCANDRLVTGYYGDSTNFDVSVIFALTSDDLGLNWKTNFVVNSAGSGFREASFCYLGNSNILCMIRRDQAFASASLIYYQAHSIDNGTTWIVDGPVSLGYQTSQRQPCSMYSYNSPEGRRIVTVIGNRETMALEAREVSAWDAFNNLTNVWLNAKVETLASICVGQGDGGYGSPIGYGSSGECLIPYYYATSNNLAVAYQAQIRFASRSPRIQPIRAPSLVLFDSNVNGVTNSTTETDMVNFTIPGATLYGNHAYDILLTGYGFNNAATTVTNRVRVYYGSTVIYDQSFDGTTVFATGTGIRPYRLGVTLAASGSQAVQVMHGFWQHGSSVVPVVGVGNINSTAFAGGIFANRVALNAKTNNVFRVTFAMSTNSPTFWFDHDSVTVNYY